MTPQKADAYVFGSYEVRGDSDFAQRFPELLGEAKDRLAGVLVDLTALSLDLRLGGPPPDDCVTAPWCTGSVKSWCGGSN